MVCQTSITYANSPTTDAVVATTARFNSETVVDIDVSSYVTGGGTFTMALTPLTNINCSFYSLESATPPELLIEQDISGNKPPTADDVTTATDEDTIGPWTPMVSDPDPGTLTCSIVTSPGNGAASVAGNCSSGSYTPDPDHADSDSFVYQVSDGSLTDTATVTVTVNPVNDDPVANAQPVVVLRDTPTTIGVTGTDVDGDCPLTLAVATPPSHGSVGAPAAAHCTSGSAKADILYTPDAGYTGPDSFTVTYTDPASSTSAPAQISITVDPLPASFETYPVADAFVDEASSGSNYGTSRLLRADGSPVARSYLRFTVPGGRGFGRDRDVAAARTRGPQHGDRST